MDFVHVSKHDNIATVVIERGKVNALDNTVVDQLRDALKEPAGDPAVTAGLPLTSSLSCTKLPVNRK